MPALVLVCRRCDVAIARRDATCPSCDAGLAELSPWSVEPVATARQMTVGAVTVGGLIPFLYAVDRCALWLLSGGF